MTLAQTILNVKCATASYTVPKWGNAVVVVKEMNGVERDAFERIAYEEGQSHLFAAHLLVHTLFDSEGKRIFKDDEASALGATPGDEIIHLYRAALRLNMLRKADGDAIAKNS